MHRIDIVALTFIFQALSNIFLVSALSHLQEVWFHFYKGRKRRRLQSRVHLNQKDCSRIHPSYKAFLQNVLFTKTAFSTLAAALKFKKKTFFKWFTLGSWRSTIDIKYGGSSLTLLLMFGAWIRTVTQRAQHPPEPPVMLTVFIYPYARCFCPD